MSGEAGGLVLLPLAIFALPVVGAVLVGGAVIAGGAAAVNAGANAVARRAEERRREREAIMRSGINESIGSFRSTLASNMNEQVRLNRQASDEMMSVMSSQRVEMQRWADPNDPVKYQQYLANMRTSREGASRRLMEIEDNFVRNYHEQIQVSMATITDTINRQYATYVNEIEQLNEDMQAKESKAREFAEQYLEEAKALMESLQKDYDGVRFSGEALHELQRALNDAITQFNCGLYEAAIASAKDTALQTIEEIYKADCKQQEFDNYHLVAISLSAELEAFLTHQEFITAEAKAEVESKTGKSLEDDVVGIRIADYTDRLQDGTNQFDYLLQKVREIEAFLESDQAAGISVEEMKEYVDMLSNKMYPAAATTCYKGVLNMNNAFSRQNVSEQIVDFFEEHNFEFTGYSYDDDRHDGTLHIGLSNETTGEEIIVTLAPELMEKEDADIVLGKGSDAIAQIEENDAGSAIYMPAISSPKTSNKFRVGYLTSDEHMKLLEELNDYYNSKNENSDARILVSDVSDSRNSVFQIYYSLSKITAEKNVLHFGEPLRVDAKLEAKFRNAAGNNLILFGSNAQKAQNMLTFALMDLMIQSIDDMRQGARHPYIFVLNYTDGTGNVMFDGVKQLSEVKLPSVAYLDSSQAVNAINQIYQYYKQKTPQDPEAWLIISNLMVATDLQSGSVYGSYSETANYFEEILREGPAKGIFTVAWCDDPTLFKAKFVNLIQLFGKRIVFNVSDEDALALADVVKDETEVLSHLCNDEAVHRPEKYMSYAKCNNPESVYIELRKVIDINKVNIQRDGRKVYIFANGITKGEALKRFIDGRKSETIIAAGDNLMDVSMLNRADIAFANQSIFALTTCKNKIKIIDEIFSDGICKSISEMRMKGKL